MIEDNQKAYASEDTVAKYTKFATLQKGEISIFENFKYKISAGKILDIGIGGGRTTSYLAPLAKTYIGIDFSQPFVGHCQKAFEDLPNVTIQYGDARDLHAFDNNSFDFILFSFNGIDYVDFDGRTKILTELSRLIKSDGALAFSFHNKGNLDKLYSFQFPRNPLKYFWEWQRMNKVREINGNKDMFKSKDWFIIKDGGENFTTDTFYIDPLYQQKCLTQVGFKTFSFYDALTGKKLNNDEVQKSQTPWIYITASK